MSSLRHVFRAVPPALVAACALLVSGGCGGREHGPYPIEPGREREQADRPVPPGGSTRDRLLPPQPPELTWEAPPTWEEQPPTDIRLASFRVRGADGDGDVSVSRATGSVFDNVNRWRQQMGLEPVPADDVAALPRRRLLGLTAVEVDLRGAYTAMGASAAKPGWRLLGRIAEARGEGLFLKFVGPEALVTAHETAFTTFADSLRLERPGAAASSPEPAPAGDRLDPSRLRWTAPPGWTAARPSHGMRAAEFRIEGAPGTEAVAYVLAGEGGGVAMNVNRWRRQMGQKDLTQEELDALERIDVLGTKAVWVEIPGTYTGMSGENVADALFVGVVCLLPTDSLFLRLVGPRAEVEKQRDAFRALCSSLKIEEAK